MVWKPGCGTLSNREHVGVEDFHSGVNNFHEYSGIRLFLKKEVGKGEVIEALQAPANY